MSKQIVCLYILYILYNTILNPVAYKIVLRMLTMLIMQQATCNLNISIFNYKFDTNNKMCKKKEQKSLKILTLFMNI